MPTFHFYKNGSKVDEMSGADKNGLEARVSKYYVEVELPEDEKPKLPESKDTVPATNGTAKDVRQRTGSIIKVTTLEEWHALQRKAQETGQAVRIFLVYV